MSTVENLTDQGHVLQFSDKSVGLEAIVALRHPIGPVAMGATRLLPYASEREALSDAMRLAEAMAYKAAVAGLPVSGGKAVIICDPRHKTEAMLRAYARFIDTLGGRFITGQDLNISVDDVRIMKSETKHVVGLGAVGPAEMTARGVVAGLTAAARRIFGGSSLGGARIAVQGLGAVGARVAETLAAAGADLIVTDHVQGLAFDVAKKIGAEAVAPDEIFDQTFDIFAPCGHGAGLNEHTIPRLKARLVAGAANNQLAVPGRDADALDARGIAYCPDFVINAGGLIEVYCEHAAAPQRAAELVAGIGQTIDEILTEAARTGTSTYRAALALAVRRRAQIDASIPFGSDQPFFDTGATQHGR